MHSKSDEIVMAVIKLQKKIPAEAAGSCDFIRLFKRENSLLAVEGKNIAAVDDAGGGLGLAGNIVPLPGQQLVGTLDAEIAHAVGVLHDHGIYRTGVQGIDRFDVGVECNHPEVLGTAKVRDSLRGTDTDGFVK